MQVRAYRKLTPQEKTGLLTLFHYMVGSLGRYPNDVEWADAIRWIAGGMVSAFPPMPAVVAPDYFDTLKTVEM